MNIKTKIYNIEYKIITIEFISQIINQANNTII
jgi:hypothetical protein